MPSFSYQFGANPPIDYPRLMISDTNANDFVFYDQEIQAMSVIIASPYQSGQFYSPPAGQTLSTSPANYYRLAAGLLDCIVANKAKLASMKRILDIELNSADAAKALAAQAAAYRDLDDNSGAFFVIEMVHNEWNLVERYWNQVARQQGVPFS